MSPFCPSANVVNQATVGSRFCWKRSSRKAARNFFLLVFHQILTEPEQSRASRSHPTICATRGHAQLFDKSGCRWIALLLVSASDASRSPSIYPSTAYPPCSGFPSQLPFPAKARLNRAYNTVRNEKKHSTNLPFDISDAVVIGSPAIT